MTLDEGLGKRVCLMIRKVGIVIYSILYRIQFSIKSLYAFEKAVRELDKTIGPAKHYAWIRYVVCHSECNLVNATRVYNVYKRLDGFSYRKKRLLTKVVIESSNCGHGVDMIIASLNLCNTHYTTDEGIKK